MTRMLRMTPDSQKPDVARWFFLAGRYGIRIHLWGHGFYLSWNRPVLFSERYGYRRVYRVGCWSVEFV